MFRFIQQQSDCRTRSRSSLGVVVGLAMTLAAQQAAAAPRLNPEHVLREWAKASQTIVPVGKAAQQRTFHEYKNAHKAHQIALINEFRGPVDADQLLKRYRFTEVKRARKLFRLTAVPRDDVEGLFMAGFEVAFSDNSFLPVSIQFVDTNGKQQGDSIALLTSRHESATEAFDRSPVEQERSVVRLAAAVDDPAGESVQQANIKFPAKQGDDSKRLQEVLNKWKANAKRTKTIRATFSRYEYDHIFHLETRARGTLAFRAPDKAKIEIEASKASIGATSQKFDKQGKRYLVEDHSKAETWIWWKNHGCMVSHASKQIDIYSKSRNPSPVRPATFTQNKSSTFVDSLKRQRPLFNSWSSCLESEFEWSLVTDTTSQLQLRGVAVTLEAKQQTDEIFVLLEPTSFRLQAMRFVSSRGNHELVYVLRDVMINVDDDAVEFVNPVSFEVPELPGYRTIKHDR